MLAESAVPRPMPMLATFRAVLLRSMAGRLRDKGDDDVLSDQTALEVADESSWTLARAQAYLRAKKRPYVGTIRCDTTSSISA
jgi:hypothetical protein